MTGTNKFQIRDIEPLQDRVLVRQFGEDELAGDDAYDLIARPDDTKEKPSVGEVLAVGPGKILENGTVLLPTCKVGDTVLFGRYTGTDIPDIGEGSDTIKIMREDEIFARVQKQAQFAVAVG